MPEFSLKSWKRADVRCLAGYKANERPLSFCLDESEIEIHTILEAWREPAYLCFKVETHDGRVYELRHHEYEDLWQARESARLDKYRR